LEDYCNFYLALGAPFAWGEVQNFTKLKGRETLRRSYSDLNTTDNNMGLTESISVSVELCA
jgi:hypothetical protein